MYYWYGVDLTTGDEFGPRGRWVRHPTLSGVKRSIERHIRKYLPNKSLEDLVFEIYKIEDGHHFLFFSGLGWCQEDDADMEGLDLFQKLNLAKLVRKIK